MRQKSDERRRNQRSAGMLRLCCALLSLTAVALGTLATAGQIAVQGSLTHEYTVGLGEVVEGTITVQNTSEEPVAVSIDQRDYLFFADGTNDYGEPGSQTRSNALWMRFALPQRLTVPPGESAVVHYWIDVPDDSGLVGTYWSILLIAPIHEESSDQDSTATIGLRAVFQYGLQIVTHIGQTGRAEVSLDGVQLLESPDGTVLQVDLGNPGERWLRPEVWVELYDEEGQLAGRFESKRQRIFPGTSVRHHLVLDVSTGTYKALIVFDNGDENVWGAQYTLDL
ncbi:MAG: hypothetical protein WBC63_05655 [Candidatus Bipolaricaulia bacterium]